ncbi:DEAD_2 domain-containing protein [mine drainage metagenome]|uniref:DEAD_2 domain-containing protein n=1 Tax=mine drainage metagenome TaxID=410659 RepID=T1B439_9ZZZZ
MVEYLFRFDKPRMHQGKMLDDIYKSLKAKGSILINAPTGIGKTDASLSAALTFAMENNLKVLFLTPKISQHRIAIEALNGIRDKFSTDLKFVDMVGKQKLCINDGINMIANEAFHKECEKLVRSGKCEFYKRFKDMGDMPKEIWEQALLGHNKLFAASKDYGICAYEVSSAMARDADVVIADYSHVLNPSTRPAFLKRIAGTLSNTIIIWDEAHNLVNLAASYMSDSITTRAIQRAAEELRSIGSTVDLSYLDFVLNKLAETHLAKESEAFIYKGDLPEEMTNTQADIVGQLERNALEYIEKSKARRSSLMHLSNFMRKLAEDDPAVAKIISKGNGSIRLALSCLYPDRIIDVLKEPYANIFMSATLIPLGMYSDLFGMGTAETRNYTSPFPERNRVAYVDDKVTTKYASRSISEYKAIADRLMKIKSRVKGNVAVFFPSFQVLNGVRRYVNDADSITQREGMSSAAVEELLNRLQVSDSSFLFGVLGGSLSEGVDYPKNIIKAVVVVGLPFAKPSLELGAKVAYMDGKFKGKGEEYAYRIPALIKVIQASGRAIRNENDRAAIVFMDKRYKWSTYISIIASAVKVSSSSDYLDSISEFFSEEKRKRDGTVERQMTP